MELPGVGPRAVAVLLQQEVAVDSPASLADATRSLRLSKGPPSALETQEAWDEALRIRERCAKEQISVLGLGNERFPWALRTIPKQPVILFVLGDPAVLHDHAVAIIGTREPTEFGVASAKKIASSSASAGFVVVSGLAEGCDTAGHQGCLAARGKTVAILAHGHGRIYPRSNIGLADEIVSQGGAIVSEYPPGSPPFKTRFVERDRLQSGLSAGIIVIETDVQGGTMHTVGFAVEQKRHVAAVDHPEKWRTFPKTRGNRHLIATNKAQPLANAEDLSRYLLLLRSFASATAHQAPEANMNTQMGLSL